MQPIEQKKRQKLLIGTLVIVAVITAFIWYSNYQKGSSIEEFIPFEAEESFKDVKDVKLDLSILDNALFKSLKSHGVLPVTPGETGRDNPFQP